MTTIPAYPFSALVALDNVKTALLLAALDGRLGVLLRGDRGAGKTTAARALATLLPGGAPFVNLPVGATEDRLLGGLDVERAMRGEPALKPGLLAQANGGVLYIDEVNLLPDHLADALLDAAASGVHVLEREGFSQSQEVRFVLIGSMNPEEGSLRPQLLDRFALAVDVSAPLSPAERRSAVERRLRFDADPSAFADESRDAEEALRATLSAARHRLPATRCPASMLERISTLVAERGVRSLRADLAIVRASLALAAIDDCAEITDEHVSAVLSLALAHRAPHTPSDTSPPPPPPSSAHPPPSGASEERRGAEPERIFTVRHTEAPRLSAVTSGVHSSGAARTLDGHRAGPVIHSRLSPDPSEVDARASIVHALARKASPLPTREDLHERVRSAVTGVRYLFVVDSSGSHAANQRMPFVKGAVVALLEASARRRDEVCVIAFRGTSATVLLEPTHNQEEARRALAHLPTGGRTPLAHGLELAARYVTAQTVLVLVTDGRANVGSRTQDAWADALTAAAAVTCPALVVDSEAGPQRLAGARALADAMGAHHVLLDSLDQDRFIALAREHSGLRDER